MGNILLAFVFSSLKCILLFKKKKTEDAFKVIANRGNECGCKVMLILYFNEL